jgi:carbon storage regulator CsrA
MLVLQRSIGESIVLDIPRIGLVQVKLLDTHRASCRLGIDGPRCVVIRRTELASEPRREVQHDA